MVRQLTVTSLWRWAALFAGLLCGVLLAYPSTAHASVATPTRAHHVTAHDGSTTPDEIAITGLDGALWVEGSGGWFSLGGYLLGAPAVASIPDPSGASPGSPVFVAIGGDRRLYVRDLSHPWQLLVGNASCFANPAAVVVSAHAAGEQVLTVACDGGDNAMWYAQELVSFGSLPATIAGSMQSLGGTIVTGVAVAPVNPIGATVNAELTFFGDGTDGHVWTRTIASGWQQTPWECSGPPAASTALSSAPNPAQITVFACSGLDFQLWISKNTGSGWSTAQPLGGQLLDAPGVAVGPQWAYFDVEGVDGQVWQNSLSYGGNLLGWSSLGGGTYAGAAAAALLFSGNNP